MSVISDLVLPEDFMENCANELEAVLTETLSSAKPWLDAPPLFVVGCSTSEVGGGRIGAAAHVKLGRVLALRALAFCESNAIALAAQCCEHLNRALVVSAKTARAFGLTQVIAIPTPEAGGAFASAVYQNQTNAVLVREVAANAGVDIGGTLIGMHVCRVAVPIRLALRKVGEAHVTAAFARAEYTGGARTRY